MLQVQQAEQDKAAAEEGQRRLAGELEGSQAEAHRLQGQLTSEAFRATMLDQEHQGIADKNKVSGAWHSLYFSIKIVTRSIHSPCIRGLRWGHEWHVL